MSFFGLTDPWIIAAYVGCILCVVFCIWYSLKTRNDPEEEEEDD